MLRISTHHGSFTINKYEKRRCRFDKTKDKPQIVELPVV